MQGAAQGQVKAANGARTDLEPRRGCPYVNEQAAADAGLSPEQHNTALRVTSLPEQQLEQRVESDNLQESRP
jgi:hypothetical protein